MNPRPHKPKAPKKTPGTLLAEAMRAEGNKLTDSEREKLGEAFMKLYDGGEPKPTATRRHYCRMRSVI